MRQRSEGEGFRDAELPLGRGEKGPPARKPGRRKREEHTSAGALLVARVAVPPEPSGGSLGEATGLQAQGCEGWYPHGCHLGAWHSVSRSCQRAPSGTGRCFGCLSVQPRGVAIPPPLSAK